MTVIATGFDDGAGMAGGTPASSAEKAAEKPAEGGQGLYTAASEKAAAERKTAGQPAGESDPFDDIFKIFNSK